MKKKECKQKTFSMPYTLEVAKATQELKIISAKELRSISDLLLEAIQDLIVKYKNFYAKKHNN